MSLVPILLTWLAGWAVYASLRGTQARLNPIGVITSYLFGTAIIYIAHYIAMLIFKANPPVAPVLVVAVLGGGMLLRHPRRLIVRADWAAFGQERRWSLVLLLGLGLMLVMTAVNGFGHDGYIIWLGRALAYQIQPDYIFHLENPYHSHPIYPPLFIHLLQWQAAFTYSLLGLKLPNFCLYLCIVAAVFSHLVKRIQSPVKWTTLTALLPMYIVGATSIVPDVALGAFITVGVYWLLDYLSSSRRSSLVAMILILSFMCLIKQESLLLLLALLTVLAMIALRYPDLRRNILSVLVLNGLAASVIAGLWYGLVLTHNVTSGDFNLALPRWSEYVTTLVKVPLIIVEPVRFQGLWFVFVGMFAWKRIKQPEDLYFGLLPLLYAVGMLLSYLFSIASIEDHIRASYSRLLEQVTPLVMIYMARILAERPQPDSVSTDAA